jgi:hypothetical protein
MENKKLLDSGDIFSMLRAHELQPRLELQSSGSTICTVAVDWANCGCGILNCCPYGTGFTVLSCP